MKARRRALTVAQADRLRDLVYAFARAYADRAQYDDDEDAHARLCLRRLRARRKQLDAFIDRHTEPET